MATHTASALETLLEKLEKLAAPPLAADLERLSEAIAKMFRLKPDEVAILEILPPGRLLRFVIPEKLGTVGTIPVNSGTALAARTARLRRTDIVNNFPSFRHASVFESVPLGQRQEQPIQKIVSSPIVRDSRVIGVVQLSRKGKSPLDAGPDFTASDAEEIKKLNDLLARLLTICRPS